MGTWALSIVENGMTYKRFVEIGRVAYIAFGTDKNKLCVIVDVIDQNRVLVDGPCSDVKRKALNLKALHLTKFVVKIPHSAHTGFVTKAWKKAEITSKWEETTWAKKIAQKNKRANLTDFDRFKLMKAVQAKNRLVTIQAGKLHAVAKKAAPKARRVNKKPSVK